MREPDSLPSRKAIEVTGMNGVSLAYVQRFFKYAGQIEQVNKQDDIVVVKFKSSASIPKALKYNGRVVDKQPIKVRQLLPLPAQKPEAHHQKTATQFAQIPNIKQLDIALNDKIFDLPFLWSSAIKIIQRIVDRRARWMVHQLLFIKLSQVVHFHAFGTNQKSKYVQKTLKKCLLWENGGELAVWEIEGRQRMQVMSLPPNDLSEEANLECVLCEADQRLRPKFAQLLNTSLGNRLFQIYQMLSAYAAHIPEGQPIFTYDSSLQDQRQPPLISKQLVTKFRASICFRQDNQNKTRSQYRNIDQKHPLKQIQILTGHTDIQDANFDVFRDDFDGNITNTCPGDLFFAFRFNFVSNYIVLRYFQNGQMHYLRLQFQLRMINCQGEKLQKISFCRFHEYSKQGQILQVNQIQLLKNNIVLGDFDNHQKGLYILQSYVKFYINYDQKSKNQSNNKLNLILIVTNPSEQNIIILNNYISELLKSPILNQTIRIYSIFVDDQQKFDYLKCSNFIEQYIDQQTGAFNMEIARAHAKIIIQNNPNKFLCLPPTSIQNFVTEQIWRLEQQRSKRVARNQLRKHIHNARMT